MAAPFRRVQQWGGLAAAAALLLVSAPRAQQPVASDTAPAAAPALPRSLPSTSQDAALAESGAAPPEAPAAAPAQPAAPAAPPAPVGRLAPDQPVPPAELGALVEGAVRQAMADRHIPGVVVAVVQNGQTVLNKGYGFASLAPLRPVDPDRTLFRVGSISKLFTWMLVMRQVEAGRMRLDAPVNLYLPEALRIRDQGYAGQVRLRDLMNHAGGFEARTLGRLFELSPGRVRPLQTYLRQEKPRRVRPAGLLPEYSNYGAALAGAAVAEVARRPYVDLVEADILRPLRLDHTTFREPYPAEADLPAPMPAPLAADLATGYAWTGASYAAQPFEYLSQVAPAGSASSTAGDLARLMNLILAGGTLDGSVVYGPAAAQAFRTVSMRSAPGVQGWAGGFMQRLLPGGFQGFGHEGRTLTFRSNLVTVPALGLGIFVAGNSDGADLLVERLPGLIVARFYAAPAPPAPAADLYASRRAYEGAYVSDNRRAGGLEQFVALLSDRIRIRVGPEGRLLVSGRDQGGAFVPTGALAQFREVGGEGRIGAFQMKDGVAQRWLSPSGMESFERVGPLRRGRTLGLAAILALTAAVATLAGLFTRDRREFRQTDVQGRASAIQTSTAILWLIAAGGFAFWAARAVRDPSLAFREWPGPWVAVASSAGLVALVCSVIQVGLLPAVWRGGRRVESWTAGRKLRFSLTALIFLGFGVILALWGALEPWSA